MPEQPQNGHGGGEAAIAPTGQLAKYEIMKRIGSGKFSVVYKARKKGGKTDSICAIKKVQVFDIKDAKAREKCLKEVKLLESLDHEHIVRYHDSFFEESVLFIVFEWAAGGDLKKLIREAAGIPAGTPEAAKHGAKAACRLDESVVWTYFQQMSEGLEYMHGLRMMHRDIKPANIFITGAGMLKLGDMGLGRQLSDDSVAAFSKVGTPLYMSPEVLKGDGYDMQSDTWSLGCVLYEMANLRSPFKTDDQNLYALFQRITACEYPPVHSAYSDELAKLVGRMVQLDPTARPPMGEVCAVAARMAKRCRSVRHPQLLAEELDHKLQLLEYDARWCRRTKRLPLGRLYFALPLPNARRHEQFWAFMELGWWLQATVQGDGDTKAALYDRSRYTSGGHGSELTAAAQDAAISELLGLCKQLRLDAATDAVPVRLRVGHGPAVCGLLMALADAALSAAGFQFKPPNHGVVDKAGEVEEDMGHGGGPAVGAGEDQELFGGVGGDGGRLKDSGSASENDEGQEFGVGGGSAEAEEERGSDAERGAAAVAWRAEAKRLAASGALRGALQLRAGSGWRVTAALLQQQLPGVLEPLGAAAGQLGGDGPVSVAELTEEVDGIGVAECRLGQSPELLALQQQLAGLGAKLVELHDEHAAPGGAASRLADGMSKLAELNAEAAAVKDEMEQAGIAIGGGAGAGGGSGPIKRIREGQRVVAKETLEMGARIDWLINQLSVHDNIGMAATGSLAVIMGNDEHGD